MMDIEHKIDELKELVSYDIIDFDVNTKSNLTKRGLAKARVKVNIGGRPKGLSDIAKTKTKGL